jgi:hypothetical protein
MQLDKLFSDLQKKGYETLGQAKSALVAAGVNPSGIACNHAELDKALSALVPVAAGVAGVGAAAAAGAANPALAVPAAAAVTQVVEQALRLLLPELESLIESIETKICDALNIHVEKVHAAVKAALPALPPAPSEPPAPTVPKLAPPAPPAPTPKP